jgi:hypothetical protein
MGDEPKSQADREMAASLTATPESETAQPADNSSESN